MSGRISQTFIQDLLARIDIVDIVSARVTIVKKGKNHQGCCPFHQEKTPSFTACQEKQFYHCFGCGAHGNAIGFIMEFDRLDFPDAVRLLADHAGIEVQHDGQNPQPSYHPLYEVLEQITSYYQKQLRSANNVIAYLKSRGLTGNTAKAFSIGYAPNDWHYLKPWQQSPNDDAMLISTGMLIQHQKKPYTRFRDRVMFPIRNLRGKVVGFGGRCLENQTPKYLNSPDTPIFHKNQELYGLYESRKANRTLTQAIVVEGYMDVIALHQHGINTAVATLGTAINAQHIQTLLRYTTCLIFCFDGDTAGQKAQWKALTISLPLLRDGVEIKFLTLPNQQDPDDFIQQQGSDAFKRHLKQAPAIADFFFQQLQTQFPLTSVASKAQFTQKASQLLDTMPNGIYQNLMYEKLATELGMPLDDLKKTQHPNEPTTPRSSNLSTARGQTASTTLKPPGLLASALLIQHPNLINQFTVSEVVAHPTLKGSILLSQLIDFLKNHPSSTGQLIAHWDNTPLQHVVSTLACMPINVPDDGLQAELQGTWKQLQQQHRQLLANELIDKAKQQDLTNTEKQQLHRILQENDEH